MPQATLRDLDLLVCHGQIRLHAPVFILNGLHTRTGFVDFFRQGLRMAAQLAICGKKLGLLQFKHALCRKPGTPFFSQFVGKAHS